MNVREIADRINSEVNNAVRYVSDAAQFGAPEVWAEAITKGDCEDYALAKFARLRDAGVPLDAMRLAIVFTETDEGRWLLARKRAGEPWVMGEHAVLVVRCEDGDVILDNRHNELVPSLAWARYDLDRIWNHTTQQWEHGA